MIISEVSPEVYRQVVPEPSCVYASAGFCLLNEGKCARMRCVVACDDDGTPLAGLIFGEMADGSLRAPFSAPFSALSPTAGRLTALQVAGIVSALKAWAAGRRMVLTLPPSIYMPELTAKTACALQEAGATVRMLVNHHYPLANFPEHEARLGRSSRRKLRVARRDGLSVRRVDAADLDGMRDAYEMVAENRRRHGYRMYMTFDDVMATMPVARGEMFLVSGREGEPVAGAVAYRTTPEIPQLIFWGERSGYESLYPMDLLLYGMAEYFHGEGYALLDLGPSGDFDETSYGLCDFKERVGAEAILKLRFEL